LGITFLAIFKLPLMSAFILIPSAYLNKPH